MHPDYTRPEPMTWPEAIFVWAVNAAIIATVCAVLGAGVYWLKQLHDSGLRETYRSCVERGGLITEPAGGGATCVGVKTPN